MVRFAPALLLALTATWSGTLPGGATFLGSTATVLSLLGLLAWIGTPWRDPLGLGPAGRWLPAAFWAFAVLSAAASPVPRAGLVGLLLLPAFFGLPGAVARCWSGEEQRRQGVRALSAVVAAVALWALLDRFLLGSPRAAMPLGHHNLLALWIATLLPLAILPAREQGGWKVLGIATGLLGVGAVVASGSLMGAGGLVVAALVGLSRLRRDPHPLTPSPTRTHTRPGEGESSVPEAPLSRGIGSAGGRGAGGEGLPGRLLPVLTLLLAIALLLALQAPRLATILSGEDPSARARAAYFEAGLEGFLARPLLGQGPGAAAWTTSLFFDPVSGVNPWGETVAELHSLPLQLAYEIGAPGLLLALALVGLFAVRRWREARRVADPGLLRAALCGLAGAFVAFLGTASLSVTALPLALAVTAGAALAGRPAEEPGQRRTLVRIYAAGAAVALAPLLAAQGLYDRALAAELRGAREEGRERLERAVRLDPAFPLYRLRLALLQETGDRERAAAAELARRAAEDGRGLGALWTVAGILGQAADRPWAPAALQTACSLDPLGPFPPWFALLADPAGPAAARHGAHALLAEPRLAAAPFWDRHPDLLARALHEVRSLRGVDPVWVQNLLDALPPGGGRAGEREWLALQLDVTPDASLSLFAFRRRPWPAEWPVVPLAASALGKLEKVGPAPAFPRSLCASRRSPQHLWKTLWENGVLRHRKLGATNVWSTLPRNLCSSRKPCGISSLKKEETAF